MPNLSSTQLQSAETIANYGFQHGFSEQQVDYAVKVAFIESSLGVSMQNPKGTAAGMFGYTSQGWDQTHASLGDRNSTANQLQAFFGDISKFTAKYNDPASDPAIRQSGLSLENYLYTKHHDGPYFSDFPHAAGPGIYNSVNFHPDVKNLLNPEGFGAQPGGHAMDLFDPIYAASHAFWYTTPGYAPAGTVTIGDIQVINGQDQD